MGILNQYIDGGDDTTTDALLSEIVMMPYSDSVVLATDSDVMDGQKPQRQLLYVATATPGLPEPQALSTAHDVAFATKTGRPMVWIRRSQ